MKQKQKWLNSYLGQLITGRKFAAKFFWQDLGIKICMQWFQRWAMKVQLNVHTQTHLCTVHTAWSSASLKMPTHAQFYRPAIWTSKLGQGDVVFDERLGFGSGSVRARFEVSVYSSYDWCHPGCPKIWLVHFDPLWLKTRSNHRLLCIHVRCTHDANCRDTAHKYFLWLPKNWRK